MKYKHAKCLVKMWYHCYHVWELRYVFAFYVGAVGTVYTIIHFVAPYVVSPGYGH